MADTSKILAQSIPSAATSTDLYTVPSATTTVASTICVCNQSATATTFRISVAVAGATLATKQYLYYDVPIGGNDTFMATIGITLGATDVVRVYATLATLSFNLFGIETT